jgi:Fe-S cluster biogenesis protein NfuA
MINTQDQTQDHLEEHNMTTTQKIDISVWPTPNPHALKFISTKTILKHGKLTFRSLEESQAHPLAYKIFQQFGEEVIANVHLFQTSITITKQQECNWNEWEIPIIDYLEKILPLYEDLSTDVNPEKERRKNLSPELLEIEEILDRTIRPGLQADGGDILCIEFKNDILLVKYQGACGTCPSSSTGTLDAIRSILTEELKKSIDVYIVPEHTPY